MFNENESIEISLSDLEPKPKGGEWYIVRSGKTDLVVLIDHVNPNLALLSYAGHTGIGNLSNGRLVTKPEAKEHLAKEIEDLKRLDAQTESDKKIKQLFLKDAERFYELHFDTRLYEEGAEIKL